MDKIGSVDDKQQHKLVKRMSVGKQQQQGGVGRGGGPRRARKPHYLFDNEDEEEELHLMRVDDEEEESTSNDSKDADLLQQQQQQTTTASDTSTSGMEFPLRNDLQSMLFGLGDCRRPLTSTLEQVETVLKQQMTSLLQLAAEVRTRCQSKANQLQPQHFLYLLARDKVKLHRLLRYLCLKDTRTRLINESGSDGVESDLLEAHNEDENDEDGEPEAEGKDGDKSGKKAGPRRQICYKFLNRMDQTGELLSQLNDEQSEDEVKMQRHARLEHQTRFMDTKGYLEFSEARTASFGRKSQVNIFSEWVASLLPGFTFHPVAMEILSYLAFETVAQLVDLALLVKNERSNWNDVYSSKNKRLKTSEDSTSKFLSMCAIQPNEIQEALRRFHKQNGAMATFAKSYTTPLRRKILCL